jgi:hypothetical protein
MRTEHAGHERMGLGQVRYASEVGRIPHHVGFALVRLAEWMVPCVEHCKQHAPKTEHVSAPATSVDVTRRYI